jgi:ligand-binding SRPBCC domain-containing protein
MNNITTSLSFSRGNIQISVTIPMPFIHLTTYIAAPQDRVFDLSRSIDLHKASMKKYRESIIDGRMNGLLDLNESVTWTARHLMKQRVLKIRLTKLQRPDYFIDEQEEGDFKMLKHEHYFKPIENGTIMIDQFHYETPMGWVGKFVNSIYLENYIKVLLVNRNNTIKQVAEGNLWNQYLN